MITGAERERILSVIVGAAGTGKTTLIRKLIDKYPGRVLIMDASGEWPEVPIIHPSRLTLWSRGQSRMSKRIVRIPVTEPETQIDAVIRMARNCLLVFDDMDAYTWLDSKLLRPIFVGYRHYGFDVIVVFHSIKRAYKPAIENMSRFIIFAQDTGSAEDLRKLGFVVPEKPYEYKIYHMRKS